MRDLIASALNNGMGQRELAARIGVSQATISNILNPIGKAYDLETMWKVANYFGKSVAYLTGEAEKPEEVREEQAAYGYTPEEQRYIDILVGMIRDKTHLGMAAKKMICGGLDQYQGAAKTEAAEAKAKTKAKLP